MKEFRRTLLGGQNMPCTNPYTSMVKSETDKEKKKREKEREKEQHAVEIDPDDIVHNYDECPPEFPYPAKEGGGYCYNSLSSAEAPPRDPCPTAIPGHCRGAAQASAVGQVTMATARHSCHLCIFHFEFSLACSSPS